VVNDNRGSRKACIWKGNWRRGGGTSNEATPDLQATRKAKKRKACRFRQAI
jgi:hypothetical protein